MQELLRPKKKTKVAFCRAEPAPSMSWDELESPKGQSRLFKSETQGNSLEAASMEGVGQAKDPSPYKGGTAVGFKNKLLNADV